ncbi:metabotropic glutamate receptor 2-like [Sycon ciliatum]|uniref:metabotropic glutamate receptor 2-like n=1 Tax=Sycon ciliatum TaxID=27933 RepID=UPI0031F6A886
MEWSLPRLFDALGGVLLTAIIVHHLGLDGMQRIGTQALVLTKSDDNFYGPCRAESSCRGRVGSVVFGGFFPLREWNYTNSSCSHTIRPEGFQRMEAMRWAIEQYRSDLDVGYDLRDSCSKNTIVRDKSLDYTNEREQCHDKFAGRPVSLVIGSSESDCTNTLATMLSIFDVPVINYASTSNNMNGTAQREQESFGKFFRTVPPDRIQIGAMIAVLEHFNWTFITFVHGTDEYGKYARDWMRKQASNASFCVAAEIELDIQKPGNPPFRQAVTKLSETWTRNASVVIVFAQHYVTRLFFEQVEAFASNQSADIKANLYERIWIASDAWSGNVPLAQRFPALLEGRLLAFQPYTGIDDGFNQDLATSPFESFPTGKRNVWYRRYFDYLFGEGNYNASTTAEESPLFYIDAKVPLVIRSVIIALQALESVLEQQCGNKTICSAVNDTSKGVLVGPDLINVLRQNVFYSPFDQMRFKFEGRDSRSFVPFTGSNFTYSILHYRKNETASDSSADFVNIGTWEASGRPITVDELPKKGLQRFYREGEWIQTFEELSIDDGLSESSLMGKRSMCAVPCRPGTIPITHLAVKGGCCWSCKKCEQFHISKEGQCVRCGELETPDATQSVCVNLVPRHPHYLDPFPKAIWSISALVFFILTLFLIFYVSNWDAPDIRATSRDLTVCCFAGMYLALAGVLVHLAAPSTAVCGVRRYLLTVPLSFCYGAMVIKTNRIYRLFARSKRKGLKRKVKYTEPYIQFLITTALASIQMVLTTIWTASAPPKTVLLVKTPNVAVNTICNEEMSLGFYGTLLYNLMLVVATLLYNNSTPLSTPEKFNERRFIKLAFAAPFPVWAIVIALGNTTDKNLVSLFIAVAVLASVAIMAIFLFLPKYYRFLAEKYGQRCMKMFTRFVNGDTTTSSGTDDTQPTGEGTPQNENSYPISPVESPVKSVSSFQHHYESVGQIASERSLGVQRRCAQVAGSTAQ